ncbi:MULTISPECIES: helix-turn-helix domain-containing protein [Lachnospiraceae]|uniref:Helix-turn-helix domain-containing protein n=1 Tax=Blautia obeum TaxID=40520 RepID=A0A414S6N0_9FIRM|nr:MULTISPECIES: helix-turn-helix domain-containing protein [Lachnospiraceae]RHG12948.1 helix-turn-helix domain-containing protein [Blautia obeum]
MTQIFRVERTKNFTVMSNHHFKNKNLTLKAKGLLSLMLSLPDDWNYNMQGLATLSRDGIDSVRSVIKELEHHGYVERHRLRNEYGFYGDTEYIIREVPLGEEND